MLTVVETSAFARRAEKLLSIEEHEDLLFYLALHPESGDEIPGTGGVRKVRYAAKGKGKSGGARVIYYFSTKRTPSTQFFSTARTSRQISRRSKRRWLLRLRPHSRRRQKYGGSSHEAEERCR
jgi:hypothetical protein